MSDNKLKIILADAESICAEGLKNWLTNFVNDMSVISIASSGREAVDLARKFRPDIILMDISMPQMDGIEALRKIKEFLPDVKIVVLTSNTEDAHITAALKSGANGYLLKYIRPPKLVAAIRALNDGIMQMSPEIVKQLIEQRSTVPAIAGFGPIKNDSSPVTADDIAITKNSFEWLDKLTNREREIFTLIARGYDNEKISKEFNLAIQTVRNQVSTIYSKLGLENRFQIIRLANKAGM